MNMNGYNNNYGYPVPGGYAYGGMMYQEPPKLSMTQGLNPEQLKSLRKTGGFSLDISEDELWRSYCTHRHENKFAVTQNDEGDFICSLCGTKFKPFEGSVHEARELVNRTIDLMETAKMQSLTLPGQTIRDFFQIEPLLKRLPDLYAQSQNDYKRALGIDGNGYYYGQENNAFAMYQNMVNPLAGNGYYDPAMMQQQTPVYGGQPAMQQPMMQQGYQQQMYAQPMMQQAMPGYGYQPQMQQQGNPFNVGSAPVVGQPQQGNTEQPQQTTVSKTLTD